MQNSPLPVIYRHINKALKFLQKLALFFVFVLMSGTVVAQEIQGFDARINAIFAASTGWFVHLVFASLPGTSFPWIVMWLVVAATIFTLYMKTPTAKRLKAF